jgi:hypothetical protein
LEFVALFTGLVVKYGGRIVHGAHPTFTPVILRQAAQHSMNLEIKPVTLVMSELWAKHYSGDQLKTLTENARLIVTPQVGEGGFEDTATRNKSLSEMRQILVQNMNVMVAVGGKLHSIDGKISGVREEMNLARSRGMACFLVGSLGGMAAEYAKGLRTTSVLRNELSDEENRKLFDTADVAATVNIIFAQLAVLGPIARWSANRLVLDSKGSWSDNFGTIRSVASDENNFQFLSLNFVTSGLLRELNLSVVVRQLTFVDFKVIGPSQITESSDGRVVIKRLPNVIYLPPAIGAGWIRKKKNTRNWNVLVRDIEKFAVGLPPNAVELSVNKNLGPFPNRPANYLFPAMGGDVLRNNSKALIGWRTCKWSDWNVKGFRVPNDAATEGNHVRLDQFRGSHA